MGKRKPTGDKVLAEKVKKTREKLGMTQEELSLALGYKTNSMISQIESGDSGMSPKKIALLAALANVPATFHHDATIPADAKFDLMLELAEFYKERPDCYNHVKNIREYLNFAKLTEPIK